MLNYIRTYIWAHLPRRVTRKQCLREAALWGGGLIAFGFFLAWRGKIEPGSRVGFVVAGVALAVALATPGLGERVYIWILRALAVFGWAVGRVVLTVTFFLIVTPLALILRATGKDPLQHKFKTGEPPKWIEPKGTDDPKRYYRQS